jgi:hypothetical protein
VIFEEYETPNTVNFIAQFGPVRGACFKDPAGNVLGLREGPVLQVFVRKLGAIGRSSCVGARVVTERQWYRRGRVSIAGNRRQVHGQEHPGLRKLADADHGPSRPMVAHLLDVGRVHGLEIAHLHEENVDVDDV